MANTRISTQQQKVNTLRDMLEKSKGRLAEVAPKHLKIDRLVRLMLAACSKTPKILDCTPESVLTFCMTCSQTGLEPIGAGGAWAIPYGNQLTFIPDYRGLVNCAKRGECVKDAYAEVVREKDIFEYELGMDPVLKHVPARGDRGELESAYCVIVFPDETKRFVVMDKSEIESIKKRSKAATSGPWKTDEAEMWKKTVVRRAMKPFVGANPQLDAAIEADDNAAKVIDVTPLKEPRAIGEAPKESVEHSDAKEDASHVDTSVEGTLPVETIDALITAVHPPKGKLPYRIETKDAGTFKTENVALADAAETILKGGLQVTICFVNKESGQWLVELKQ